MRLTLRIGLLLSILLHLAFFKMSAWVSVIPPPQSAPSIHIGSIDDTALKNDDMAQGRVEDLPKAVIEEIPDKADILSRSNQKAHSPELGDKYAAAKTALPRKKITAPAPTIKKSPAPIEKSQPQKQKTVIASLPRKIIDLRRKRATPEIDLFSEEAMADALQKAKADRARRDTMVRERRSPRPTTKITDQTELKTAEIERLSGIPQLTGSDLDTFIMNNTNDTFDMGDEAIVSLNTREFKYVTYFQRIKKAVEMVWTYPEEAVITGASGSVYLRISLNKTGELVGVALVRSSGYKILDDEALLAIKSAAPYPPFPPNLHKQKLHIVGQFDYEPVFSQVH